jgi:energy-coupling factor transporter ATP-binding protein EcfA2
VSAGVKLVGEKEIAITKIISAACRNFMHFKGVHTMEFEDGINTIVGGNASGKSSMLWMINKAISSERSSFWNRGVWRNNDHNRQTMLELRFIAGGREHHLRRVIQSGDHTTDVHLYIGEGNDAEFLRDGEALKYLSLVKQVHSFDGITASADDYFMKTTHNGLHYVPNFRGKYELLQDVNKALNLTEVGVTQLLKSGEIVMAETRDGRLVALEDLSVPAIRIVFFLAKILAKINEIDRDDLSRVILIDDFEIGLDSSAVSGLFEAMSEISTRYNCQMIVTSRILRGRINPIRLNIGKIPGYYLTHNRTNNHINRALFKKYINQKVNWNWKP